MAGRSREAAGGRIAGLFGRRLFVLRAGLQAVDAVILGAVLFFGLLIVVFRARVPDPYGLLARTAAWGAAYAGSIYLQPLVKNRVLTFFLRTGAVQLMCAQLFLIAQRMQMIVVHHWQDPAVLKLEAAVFGVQPTVWLQKFISPPLTEWMMFAYVIYLVIYPGLGALIYFRRGEKPLEDYLFTLAVTNVVCFLGFLVFPIAGPLYHMREAYTRPPERRLFHVLRRIYPEEPPRDGGQPSEPALRHRHGHVEDVPPLRPSGVLRPGPGHPVALRLHVLSPLSLLDGQRRWHPDGGCGYTAFRRRSSGPGIRRPAREDIRREDFHHRGQRVHRLHASAAISGPGAGTSTAWSGQPPISTS